MEIDRERIRSAWQGRISGCQLGKPLEVLSMVRGRAAVLEYLEGVDALPLRDYVPLVEGSLPARLAASSCREQLTRSEPDDDINYTVLALLMLEKHGAALTTTDVARAWLSYLPAGATFTAERAAYRTLLDEMAEHFVFGAEPGFDLAACADNPYSDWIGAQIRADLYGWVCPGRPSQAAELARQDAALSHTGDGIHGAAFVAALGAAIPGAASFGEAVHTASQELPTGSGAAEAVARGASLVGSADAVEQIHAHYDGMSPVHTLNNLALVVWALLSAEDDYARAVGDVVAAGLDTDCNGATVGGLWGLAGRPIPEHFTKPWNGRVAVTLAGHAELELDDLVARTVRVAEELAP